MRTRTRQLRQQKKARLSRQLNQRQQMFIVRLAQEQAQMVQMNQVGGML